MDHDKIVHSFGRILLFVQIILTLVVLAHLTGVIQIATIDASIIQAIDAGMMACTFALLCLPVEKDTEKQPDVAEDITPKPQPEVNTASEEIPKEENQVLNYRYKDVDKLGSKFYAQQCVKDESLPQKLLIVDDSITTLKLLSAFLRRMNIDASMATSGNEAIEAVKRERFALILMDHMMKGKDGLDTVKEIRQLKDAYYQNVPIVDMLPMGMTQNDSSLNKEYYQAYLAKPVDYELLMQVMITFGLYIDE